MYNNLLNMGISKEVLNEMENKYGEAIIQNLNTCYKDVFKILNALKSLKINDIDNILINKIDLFFMDYDEFILKLQGKDLKEISNRINDEGGFAIDEIFFDLEC